MTTVNDSLSFLAELRASLTDGNLPTIDFDRLTSRLADLSAMLERSLIVELELQHLRDDYLARIIGMAKAIAAARSAPDAYPQVAEFIDSLSTFTAEQLTDTYRRVSARFRDTFPTSYGQFFDHHHQPVGTSRPGRVG